MLLAAMTLTGLCLSSAFALPIEQMKGVKPYGQLIDVNGKKMNVAVLGENNKETLVLVPGQSEISSYYGFHNLDEDSVEKIPHRHDRLLRLRAQRRDGRASHL